jgi:hypothetical protein
MKRSLLLAVALVLAASPAVLADHGEAGNFYPGFLGDRWNETVTEEFCIAQDFVDRLGAGAKYNNARDAMVETQNRWEDATNQDAIFFPAGNDCGDFAAVQRYVNNGSSDGAFCATIPQDWNSSFQYENLDQIDSGALGLGIHCDRNSNGKIDYFVVIIDSDRTDSYHFNHTTSPGDQKYDFMGVTMHEFGHATGFTGHMNNACAHDSTWATMCQGTWGHFSNQPFGSGAHTRTLTAHDVGAANEVYPAP